MRTSSPILLVPLALALLLGAACDRRGGALPVSSSGATVGRVAPGFDGATAWLNVDHPLTKEELKGEVVVVDFWTSCCVNCLQTLPLLAEVERKFAGRPVAVIGVHSGKFDAEKDADRLRAVVLEHAIAHPVAVDGAMRVWEAWGIQAWPTIVVLDSAGRVAWMGAGEPAPGAIDAAVQAALEQGAKAGTLAIAPLKGLRREPDTRGPLAFPGKVTVLADGSLAVSDTGHDRVVLSGQDGSLQAVVGSGLAGFTDGAFATATFRRPRGLVEVGDLLYVADTENHAVRVIDRRARTVSTVAGTGELGASPLAGPTPSRTTPLRSPWDLAAVGRVVYVALAGSHQIGALSLDAGTIEAFAGDGQEARLDGAGRAASFAQPSGLATDGVTLYVADSESSSVRAVTLASRDVHTLVGQDLFVFGDVDGPAPRVRLEHPVGIAWGPGAIWLADTYNSKIKQFDLQTGVTRTVLGGRDHQALFEPEGLSLRGGSLVVADTKHHRVVTVDTKTGATSVVEVHGLAAPVPGVAVIAPEVRAAPAERIVLGDVPLARRGASVVHFDWETPKGTGINEEAPFHLEWSTSDGLASVPGPIRSTGATVRQGFDLTVTPIEGSAGGRLAGQLDVVLCDVATHLVCVPVRRAIEVTFRLATSKAERAVAVIPLPAARP